MVPSNSRPTARLARSVGVLVVLVALAWPTVSSSTGGAAAPGDGLTLLWTFKAKNAISYDPTVVDGVVYAPSDDGVVHAIDAATGEELWQVPSAFTGTFEPAVGDGVLLTLEWDKETNTGRLVAVDLASGGQEARWAVELDASPFGQPTITDDGLVLVSTFRKEADESYTYRLSALSTADGTERWGLSEVEQELEGGDAQRWEVSSYYTIVAADGMIWLDVGKTMTEGRVALNAADGRVLWHVDLGFPTGGFLYRAGTLYGTARDARVFAQDAETGELLWEAPLADDGGGSFPWAIDSGAFYVSRIGTDDRDEIVAIDLAERAVRWSVAAVPGNLNGLVAADGRVFAAVKAVSGSAVDPGGLFVYDAATGEVVAQDETPAAGLAVAGGVVYAASGDRTLRAYRYTGTDGNDGGDEGVPEPPPVDETPDTGVPEPPPVDETPGTWVPEPPPIDETPDTDEGVPEPPPVDETPVAGVYKSALYGYTLTYDPDVWQLTPEDDPTDDAYEWITLSNGVSTVWMVGTPDFDPDELSDCVEFYLIDQGFDNGAWEAEPIDALTEEESRAFANYALSGPLFDLKGYLYLECRAIGDGATLAILHFAGPDAVENEDDGVPDDEVAAVTKLLAGLTVPDAGPGDDAQVTETPKEGSDGETYVSPTWGFTVTWDPADWVRTGRERDDRIEFHIMGDVLVMAVIAATEGYGGDPAACLAGVVEAAQGDTPLVPADDLPAPATAEEAVGGVYELGDFAVLYYECRPLVAGKAVLQVRFGAPAYAYEAALPAVEELLAGIEVP